MSLNGPTTPFGNYTQAKRLGSAEIKSLIGFIIKSSHWLDHYCGHL